ncbi:hypothetical protein BU038_12050 [Staphylococcus simulans]|uniref:hypothetical protein n=1 Tax=Staphylococcus simulans TaxID=1286 RepID=UPI000D1D8157|nr:hypothetical protein [Staphylococcus simulans]PTJ12722.1 hypothetical protein BU038_12050 [Staphylococcus simulans]
MREKKYAKNHHRGSYSPSINFGSFFSSIKNHLGPNFRRRYNIRRFFGCLCTFYIISSIIPYINRVDNYGGYTFIAIIWTFFSWIFWHYSFWKFRGGIIDTISRNIIYFGSIWSIIWKLTVQNILIVIWIAFIAPISGFFTWRRAVKDNLVLHEGENI